MENLVIFAEGTTENTIGNIKDKVVKQEVNEITLDLVKLEPPVDEIKHEICTHEDGKLDIMLSGNMEDIDVKKETDDITLDFMKHELPVDQIKYEIRTDVEDQDKMPDNKLSELPRNENLESQDVESAHGETNVCSQLDPDEGDDDGSRSRMGFSVPPTTRATSMIHSKKKKNFNNIHGLLNRSQQQREERTRQRAEDRRKLLEENKTIDDPLSNFFLSMYQLVKNMPPRYQHKIRSQVFRAVSEAEAEIMNIPFNRPPSTFSSHDSDASSIVLHSPYPTSHPLPQTSSYSQHITPIEKVSKNLSTNYSQPNI